MAQQQSSVMALLVTITLLFTLDYLPIVCAQFYERPEVPDYLQRPDPQDLDPHEYHPGYAPRPAHGPAPHSHGPAVQSHAPAAPAAPAGGQPAGQAVPSRHHQPHAPAGQLGQIAQAHDLAGQLANLPQQFLGQANQAPSGQYQSTQPGLSDTIGSLADKFTNDILRLFHL